jgi:coenzyme Q-binding protein COQ10
VATARLLRRVRHTPEDVITLVSDVEKYPEFINLLSAIRVTNRESVSDTHERFSAEASVAYKFIRENFQSVVNVHHDSQMIKVTKANKSGAVKSLKNDWVFHELSDGSTLVDFFVEVKLKAFPLEMVLREKFDKAGRHIMNLFETRAGQIFDIVGDVDLDLDKERLRLGIDQPIA